jgi:hypothetical protein
MIKIHRLFEQADDISIGRRNLSKGFSENPPAASADYPVGSNSFDQ